MTVRTLLIAAVVAVAATAAAAMNTKVGATETFCFRQHVARDTPLTFQFKVTAGGKLDINTEIYDASGRRVRHWELATEGHFTVHGDASNNHYRFCFNNAMARFTPKWVSFFLHHGANPGLVKPEDLDPIEREVLSLSERMNTIRQLQDSLRIAEHDHRNSVEDANDRVLLWSLIETGALVATGIVQVIFIKRFLEVRSSV